MANTLIRDPAAFERQFALDFIALFRRKFLGLQFAGLAAIV
jgi:hypothetical protein